MTNESQKEFLDKSGLKTMRNRLLTSCSLKEFLELMESKVEYDQGGSSDELRFVSEFLLALE